MQRRRTCGVQLPLGSCQIDTSPSSNWLSPANSICFKPPARPVTLLGRAIGQRQIISHALFALEPGDRLRFAADRVDELQRHALTTREYPSVCDLGEFVVVHMSAIPHKSFEPIEGIGDQR